MPPNHPVASNASDPSETPDLTNPLNSDEHRQEALPQCSVNHLVPISSSAQKGTDFSISPKIP